MSLTTPSARRTLVDEGQGGVDPRALISAIAAATHGEANMDLALYVHIPFCAAKCHFCDWVVDVPTKRLRAGRADRETYIAALTAQIRFYGPQLTRLGYRPKVMYWGGGTPTRLSPDELRELEEALTSSFDLDGLEQWTVETTPNDLSDDKLAALLELGVDRVSVGVQSLNPVHLRRAGRFHDPDEALAALHRLQAAGVTEFNVDLISGFPGEPLDSFADTLRQVLAVAPPHISVYPYRATPETVMAMQLGKGWREALSPPRMIAAYELAMQMLTRAGYHEYCHGYWVTSPTHEDRDGNFKYDLAGDKIGFGSGAESIIGHHLLWNKNTEFERYLADSRRFTVAERFSLARPQRLTAPIGGALMTREGVVFERFRRLTGLDFTAVRHSPYIRRWLEILEDLGGRLVATDSSLRMDPATIHRAYIGHVASTITAGVDPERA